MKRNLLWATVWFSLTTAVATAQSPDEPLQWHSDYGHGMKLARQQQRLLLVYFRPEGSTDDRRGLESRLVNDRMAAEKLSQLVLVSVSADETIQSGGQSIRLLDHPSMAALNRQPGLAVIDFADRGSAKYKHVVAALPLPNPHRLRPRQVVALLEQQIPLPTERQGPIVWHTNYRQAMEAADVQGKLLLIYFQDPKSGEVAKAFEQQALADPAVRRRLRRYVLAVLPTDARVSIEGKRTLLLDHPSFQYMYGRGGIAIIDTVSRHAGHYKQVVSAFPIDERHQYDTRKMKVILDLPSGTITQRTLIYAVRIHDDAPASTDGMLHQLLAHEAERHSVHQASINLQGHHNWSSRFQQITAKLPGGMKAVEVCAESWPGEELVDAAIECVNSWRQSSGHWNAVRSAQPLFGYDMKLGSGRIWYATGIFGRR